MSIAIHDRPTLDLAGPDDTAHPSGHGRDRGLLVVVYRARDIDAIVAAVGQRARPDRDRIHVVLPRSGAPGARNAMLCGDPYTGQFSVGLAEIASPWARADDQLDDVLLALELSGFTVTGEVGSSRPLLAATSALSRTSVEEVIVAAPRRWLLSSLGLDLATRIRRRCGLPVVSATA